MTESTEKNNDFTFSSLSFEFSSIISSLLASSCCIIQLFLNIFSFGCAGFAIFDKFEVPFMFLTLFFLSLLIKIKGIKKAFKTILLCICLSASKRIVNLFLKDNTIKSNIYVTVKGVKCNGCALKLCSQLSNFVKKCSIDSLNPPIAKICLETEKKYDEKYIRNKILSVNLEYKILEFSQINH